MKKNGNYSFTKVFIYFFFQDLLLLTIYKKIINNNFNEIKVCLCTVGKYENNYIIEFVEHYFKYNVDKIFLYDNNDINGERFEKILDKYIKINYVEIINNRGQKGIQRRIFTNCYKRNYNNYDWLIFYDLDEFINLKGFSNIKDFLKQKKFHECESIYLNWIIHTDNNLLYYDNRTLFKRFPEKYTNKKFCRGKTILKGHLERQINFHSTHTPNSKIVRCNGFGKKMEASYGIDCKIPDFKFYFIDHFFSKSTEEFIYKIKKGDCIFGDSINNMRSRINFYFRINKKTLEKINLIKQRTRINTYITKNRLILGKRKANFKIQKESI